MASTGSAEERGRALGLEYPPPPPPIGMFKAVVVSGNLAFVSGQGPLDVKTGHVAASGIGKVGVEKTPDEAFQVARQCGVSMLAALRRELGSLDRVKRVVKLTGFVNCVPEFKDQPKVINGCSELLRQVFGEQNGIGARSAVGMASLPFGMTVEVEGIFEIHPEQISTTSKAPATARL